MLLTFFTYFRQISLWLNNNRTLTGHKIFLYILCVLQSSATKNLIIDLSLSLKQSVWFAVIKNSLKTNIFARLK